MYGSRARSVRGKSRIPLNRRTPRRECSAERELFVSSYCRKAKLTRALLLPRPPTTSFRVYREPIELRSNPARMASMRRNRKKLLSIFSAFSYTPVTIEEERQREAETVCRPHIHLRVRPKMLYITALTERFAGSHVEQSLPAIGFRVILSAFSYARSRLSPSN
jgi:hypothetical protein